MNRVYISGTVHSKPECRTVGAVHTASFLLLVNGGQLRIVCINRLAEDLKSVLDVGEQVNVEGRLHWYGERRGEQIEIMAEVIESLNLPGCPVRPTGGEAKELDAAGQPPTASGG